MTDDRSFTDGELLLLDDAYVDGLAEGRAEGDGDLDLLERVVGEFFPTYDPGEGPRIAELRRDLRRYGIETR